MNAPAPPPKQADALRDLAWSDADVGLECAYEQMMKARPTPNATIETVKQAGARATFAEFVFRRARLAGDA
jgi:hypothetical protein